MSTNKSKKRTASETPDVEPEKRSKKRTKNTPAPDPDLPSKTLQPAHTQWLEQYKVVYRSNVTTKGTRTRPATEWVKNNILQPFIDEFFSNLTEDQKTRYKVLVWRSLYNWLNNSTSSSDKVAKMNPPTFRICKQWVWSADHRDFVDQEWRKKCGGDNSLLNNIGARRSFTLKLFQSQSAEVQRTYVEKCADMKAKAKMRGELDANSTKEVMKDALRKITALGRELETKAGLYLVANVAGRVGNMMQVKQAGSPLGIAYLDGPAGRKSGALLGDWLLEQEDQGGDGGDPSPAVCPLSFENKHPVIPDIDSDEMLLPLCRSFVRTYWSAIWQRQGGGGKVPYSEIEKAPEQWVDPARCPPGVVFQDPAQLLISPALDWITHLRGWQTTGFPEEKLFCFKRVYTPGIKDFPSCPEASERVESERSGKPVWLVTYSTYPKSAQNSRPIHYPPPSWSYFYFLQSGQGPSDAKAGPDHWNGLPSRLEDEPSNQNAVFSSEEIELVRSWFKDCDDDVKALVEALMKAVADMEDKVPVWTDLGIWEKAGDDVHTLPWLFPYLAPGDRSRAGFDYLNEFWMPQEYSLPFFKTDDRNTLAYLENWFDLALTSAPSCHLRSKTLVGGKNGVIWIARALLRCLGTIGAVIPDAKVSAPTPVPTLFNVKRISVNDWEHAQQWCTMLLSSITDSNILLAWSCDERRQPAEEHSAPENIDDPALGNLDIAVPDGPGREPSMDEPTSSVSLKKKKKPTRKSDKGKDKATAIASTKENHQQAKDSGPGEFQEETKEPGYVELRLKEINAACTERTPQLKAAIERELEEGGVRWVCGVSNPLSGPVGTGERPQWDQPRSALADNIESLAVPVNNWATDGASWKTAYNKKILTSSISRARTSAVDYPHLDQTIWQHAYLYERCQSWWEISVSAQYVDFMTLFGEGSGLLGRLYDVGLEGVNGGVRKKTITTAQIRVTQAKLYWKQVEALLQLATKWTNKHQECWLWARECWNLRDKVRLVEDLVLWQAETAALIDRLDEEAEDEWAKAGFNEDMQPVRAWFPFGNPMEYAVDDAAKLELVQAKKELERSNGAAQDVNTVAITAPNSVVIPVVGLPRPRPRPVARPPPSDSTTPSPETTNPLAAKVANGQPVRQSTESSTESSPASPPDMSAEQPVDDPADAPANAPSTAPTDAPANATAGVPADVPADAPADAPADVPAEVANGQPVRQSTETPTKSSSTSPPHIAVENPVAAPADVPANAPADSPVVGPAKALVDVHVEQQAGPAEGSKTADILVTSDIPQSTNIQSAARIGHPEKAMGALDISTVGGEVEVHAPTLTDLGEDTAMEGNDMGVSDTTLVLSGKKGKVKVTAAHQKAERTSGAGPRTRMQAAEAAEKAVAGPRRSRRSLKG
ncbi:hypothetical protein BDV93DRAFT_566489 [Ceratobasidium sp. AG-I]|nr:hypothetical protein BDV93DRAFT_566489 [Ceratobasidium sp. AG-I]